MLPEPLHPAIVHFPIVLAVLLPIFALGAWWAIRRGVDPRRAWAVPVLFAALLAGSAWLAVETGESEEEAVERVVAEEALHEHEEAGERFLLLSGVLFLVAGTGLFGGTLGKAGRIVGTAGSLLLVLAAVQVGEAGGELVYRHGAAQVYVDRAAGPAGDMAAGAAESMDEDDEEH